MSMGIPIDCKVLVMGLVMDLPITHNRVTL